MISRARRAFVGVAVALGLTGTALATLAIAQPSANAAAAADDPASMPYAVEDFAYPGAARIELEQGIKIKRGDGLLVLVDCTQPWDVMVETRIQSGRNYCFDALGPAGYLTVEIPDAYAIWTKAVSVQAKLTADGSTTSSTVNVAKNAVKPVGEGDGNTGNKRSVLVEIRITG
ncbi:hypothetical protein ACFUAG_29065 [Streptomyces sp. NPDC057193]|uniref:hypothetical protein n=1 Tax=Streptomyces sp. NPDC057193 TaxID=3346043 RepID=UPI00363D599C